MSWWRSGRRYVHTRAVPSSDAVRTREPSGLNDAPRIGSSRGNCSSAISRIERFRKSWLASAVSGRSISASINASVVGSSRIHSPPPSASGPVPVARLPRRAADSPMRAAGSPRPTRSARSMRAPSQRCWPAATESSTCYGSAWPETFESSGEPHDDCIASGFLKKRPSRERSTVHSTLSA